jgi:hypothetical protein
MRIIEQATQPQYTRRGSSVFGSSTVGRVTLPDPVLPSSNCSIKPIPTRYISASQPLICRYQPHLVATSSPYLYIPPTYPRYKIQATATSNHLHKCISSTRLPTIVTYRHLFYVDALVLRTLVPHGKSINMAGPHGRGHENP